MDIVLNTTFNNARLPDVQLPGFADDFDRPEASSLGETLEGKEWQYSTSQSWAITASGNALGMGAAPLAYVDGMRSDGTLTAVVGKAPSEGADPRGGLAARIMDPLNYVFVTNHSTGNSLNLYVREGGSSVVSQNVGAPLVVGDALSLVLAGSLVTVLVNGVERHSEVIPTHAAETRHGFYSHSACDMEWDSIEFTPA